MTARLRNFGRLPIGVLLLAGFALFQAPAQQPEWRHISFTRYLALVDPGAVRAVDIDWPEIEVSTINGETLRTFAPNDPSLLQRLRAKEVVVAGVPPQPSHPRDTAE